MDIEDVHSRSYLFHTTCLGRWTCAILHVVNKGGEFRVSCVLPVIRSGKELGYICPSSWTEMMNLYFSSCEEIRVRSEPVVFFLG